MASDFTVWRIHECNANFLKNFISDKHRLILWLCAFFLIFWNRGADPATEREAWLMAGASGGTFLLFAFQSLIANRLFGRETELLAGWFLLACPGFLIYARFGMLQPLAAGLTLGVILYMAYAPTFGRIRSAFFGFFCSLIMLCSTPWAGLLPLICVGFLRKSGKKFDVLKILFFIFGCSVIELLIFWSSSENAPLFLRDFGTVFAQRFHNSRSPEMDYALIAMTFSPLFWLAVPGMDAVHRRLTEDRQTEKKLTAPLLAVLAGCIGGAADFGVPAILPCLAVTAAWVCTAGKKYAEQWRFRWDEWALKSWGLILPLLILAGFSGLILPQIFSDSGISVTESELYYSYFRLPAAALLALAVSIFGLVKKKYCTWGIILPAVYCILLILMP